jgi:UDP-glucose 4-epimerase
VDCLLQAGRSVTLLDNMSNGNKKWLEEYISHPNLRFIEGDLENIEIVKEAMEQQEQVWHLAGNADIPLGRKDTLIDINSAVYGTRNLLQAMTEQGVREIIFASSGSVYGDLAQNKVNEQSGPLYPLSMYAAGKIAAEAFISSYCNLFDIKAWIFRFGNVLGSRMPRGVIRDFLTRLNKNGKQLTILGDGKQSKSYFLVEDCIDGMQFIISNYEFKHDHKVEIFNLGNSEMISVMKIADEVIKALLLYNVEISFSGGKIGWPGDQPNVNLDVTKVKNLGWEPSHNSDEAVNIAICRMKEYLQI